MKKHKLKMNKAIFRSIAKIGMVLIALILTLSWGRIPATNSFFSDSASINGNTVSTGYWIPVLSMSVNPPDPDGDNGWYVTHPCIILTSSISDVTIYYEFSNDGDPLDGTAYAGGCIYVPGGDPTRFQAQAANKANSSWLSNIVSDSLKVDTVCPDVEITEPDDGDEVDGEVEIRGSFSDANPKEYKLKIKDSSGDTVYSSGYISISHSFSDKLLYDWDTESLENGVYRIKLTGKDQAGNKCEDSIKVEVENEVVEPGDVVINELMWMGSDGDADDEWIELRNMTGHKIDISNWNIEHGGMGAGGHIEIPNGYYIKSGGYFLITKKKWDETAISLSGDLDKDEGYTHVAGMNLKNTGEVLILKDKDGNVIDTAWQDDTWPKGENGTDKKSMERKDPPGDGTSAGKWQTCDDESCNDTTYWDSEGNNYGTPGKENL